MLAPVSPLSVERYELKYLIPISAVEPISKYVENFCDLDYFSKISPDKHYNINSLYFDTPSFLLTRKKENNDPNAFNLRIRNYGEGDGAPYFFETKQKIQGFSVKKRGKVEIENFQDLILQPDNVNQFKYNRDPNVQLFLQRLMAYGAEPMVLTTYRRKAYFSMVDNYVRVTFDRGLQFQKADGFSMRPNPDLMSHYDHPESFLGTRGANIVLELKCEKKIPMWMIDMIRYFGLQRQSFSKFRNAIYDCYGRERLTAGQG
jgi:hypothetical protein